MKDLGIAQMYVKGLSADELIKIYEYLKWILECEDLFTAENIIKFQICISGDII